MEGVLVHWRALDGLSEQVVLLQAIVEGVAAFHSDITQSAR